MQSLLARSPTPGGLLHRPARTAGVRCIARASSNGASQAMQPSFNIHGRHVDVTPELETYVLDKLNPILAKLRGAEFVEGEAGGVDDVDVRLMNTCAAVTLIPQHQHKEMHDTFLRQGKLTAAATGNSTYDSFDKAVCVLERKLKRWSKAKPLKTNYRALHNRR